MLYISKISVSNKNMKNKNKLADHQTINFPLIALMIIFGSGLLIWGYNFIRGVDLSKPPQVDYSQFKLTIPSPEEVFGETAQASSYTEAVADKNNETLKESFVEALKKESDLIKLKPGIYFNQTFKADTAESSMMNILNFLKDFPELSAYQLTDLMADKCALIELPVANREILIKEISVDPAVEKLTPVELPKFETCFVETKYYAEILTWSQKFKDVKLLTTEKKSDYLARLDWGSDYEKIKGLIDQLKLNFSDVILIVE
jgi:hypothetical protein